MAAWDHRWQRGARESARAATGGHGTIPCRKAGHELAELFAAGLRPSGLGAGADGGRCHLLLAERTLRAWFVACALHGRWLVGGLYSLPCLARCANDAPRGDDWAGILGVLAGRVVLVLARTTCAGRCGNARFWRHRRVGFLRHCRTEAGDGRARQPQRSSTIRKRLLSGTIGRARTGTASSSSRTASSMESASRSRSACWPRVWRRATMLRRGAVGRRCSRSCLSCHGCCT